MSILAAMTKPAAPRRRNAEKTKADILDAAQRVFAEQGYPQAGIRDIGEMAGVSSTLLLRYYGSKAGLFEAALKASMPLGAVLEQDRSRLGEKLAALFLDRDIDIKPPSIVVLSTGDPEAREISTRILQEEIIAPLARWLGPPDAQARALEILILAMGFVLFTRQLPLISASKAQEKKVAAWLAESLQRIIDRS